MFSSHLKHFAAGPPPLPARANKPIVCYRDRSQGASGGQDRGTLSGAARYDSRRAGRRARIGCRFARKICRRARYSGWQGGSCGRVPRARLNWPRSTKIIVNDRLDVALAAGAAGVHLGHASVAAREAVEWCRRGNAPSDFLIGVSCHEPRRSDRGGKRGSQLHLLRADLRDAFEDSFRQAAWRGGTRRGGEAVRIPVIAIGGMNEANARECIRAGAAGIAAIRMIQDAPDSAALKKASRRQFIDSTMKCVGDSAEGSVDNYALSQRPTGCKLST